MPGCRAAAHLGCTGYFEGSVLAYVAPDAPYQAALASCSHCCLVCFGTALLPVCLKGMSQAS